MAGSNEDGEAVREESKTVLIGEVEIFDGTPLLFFHLRVPPCQLLRYIKLLDEPYSALLRMHPEPSPPLTDSRPFDSPAAREASIEQLLVAEKITSWNFDLFHFRELAGEEVLSRLAWKILNYFGLVEKLSLNETKLRNFLAAVENGYNACLYHNRTHAADVIQACFCLLLQGNLYKRISTDDLLAVLLAAAAHDLAHPGIGNAFLLHHDSALAERLNFASVLEKFHAGFCLHLLESKDTDILAHLPHGRQEHIKNTILQSIAVTDMSVQQELLDALDARDVRLEGRDTSADKASVYVCAAGMEEESPPFFEEDESLLIIKSLLHAADLSNVSKDWAIHIQWSHAVIAEFFCQGELERHLNRNVSAHCVRKTEGARIAQKNFIKSSVIPLYEKMGKAIAPLESFCLQRCQQMQTNISRWEDLGY